ncbi:MAG: hypothetical protein JJU27_05530 [Gammaproteobacteria bacterium]|nr:hypothetical protein [Gammaproteobacteria bacterium]
MSKQDPGDRYSPDPNYLERRVAAYLAHPSVRRDDDHRPATNADSDELRNATRQAVVLAMLAGIISGGLIGGSEVWIRQGLLGGMEDLAWREQLPYWTGFLVFTGIISAIEIAFLYWVALRGVVRVTRNVGLVMGKEGYPGLFARGMARGALEFPSPRVEFFGVDPYAYVSRWRLAARNIGYKMKVGVSSFLLRVFARRVAARLALRGMVPLIAGPLYAAWNAYIVWRIMREARVRALGPAAVDAVLHQALGEGEPPDDRLASAILQGTGEIVRRGCEAHPNYVYLLSRLCEELGYEDEIDVKWNAHCAALEEMKDTEQARVLAVLSVAAIVGSKTRRGQKSLLREAAKACGRQLQESKLKALRSGLVSGRAIGFQDTQLAYSSK